MKDKKDLIPIALAAIIALVVTGLVRLLMPGVSSVNAKKAVNDQISMPDIPLMSKDKTKKKSSVVSVLVLARDIKKDEKISADSCVWKKWPEDVLQPYFIAKDGNEIPLNNGADYSNAMKMWAKNDIPSGIPLTMQMLTDEDPVKRIEREKQEALKKEQERKEKMREHLIKPGMRAITFPINQKTNISANMIAPGDIIDVLIIEHKGEKTKTHKYKGLKIIAIDGSIEARSTINTNTKAAPKSDGIGDVIGAVKTTINTTPLASPKNVTLEVREDIVEAMLKQAGETGITISIRNQDEAINEKELYLDLDEEPEKNAIINDILEINRHTSMEKLLENKAKNEAHKDNVEQLMDNIHAVSGFYSGKSMEKLLESKAQNEASKSNIEHLMDNIHAVSGFYNGKSSEAVAQIPVQEKENEEKLERLMDNINAISGFYGGKSSASLVKKATDEKESKKVKYEIVSGKVVGEEVKPEEKKAVIYKKLTAQEIKFDKNGNIASGDSGGSK
ncbi:MAG: hypothetical protein LBB29_00470 [Holosporaceae bacterium]|jgi:Flp pilus assembly protein CpaB|nr:hypothetical protein [Holosporaceae bacterium]